MAFLRSQPIGDSTRSQFSWYLPGLLDFALEYTGLAGWTTLPPVLRWHIHLSFLLFTHNDVFIFVHILPPLNYLIICKCLVQVLVWHECLSLLIYECIYDYRSQRTTSVSFLRLKPSFWRQWEFYKNEEVSVIPRTPVLTWYMIVIPKLGSRNKQPHGAP